MQLQLWVILPWKKGSFYRGKKAIGIIPVSKSSFTKEEKV